MTGMESAEAQANYCRIVALLVQDKAKKDAAEKARAPRVDAVAGHSTPPRASRSATQDRERGNERQRV